MEKVSGEKLPFLDVMLDNSRQSSLTTTVFRKKTFTCLVTNYFSVSPVSYKLGFVKTLVGMVFTINNSWQGNCLGY